MLQRLLVIFATLALTNAQTTQPLLEVNITRSVICPQSERAGVGDKVKYSVKI